MHIQQGNNRWLWIFTVCKVIYNLNFRSLRRETMMTYTERNKRRISRGRWPKGYFTCYRSLFPISCPYRNRVKSVGNLCLSHSFPCLPHPPPPPSPKAHIYILNNSWSLSEGRKDRPSHYFSFFVISGAAYLPLKQLGCDKVVKIGT